VFLKYRLRLIVSDSTGQCEDKTQRWCTYKSVLFDTIITPYNSPRTKGAGSLKHWRILLLGVIVSCAAIYMIASQIDLNLLAEALRSAMDGRGLFWLAASAVIMTVGLMARAVRWRLLLSGGLPFWRAFHIMNIAYLVNGLLPLRIGEVARMWLASRGSSGVPMLRTASTVIVERMLDLLAVVLFVAAGLAFASDSVPPQLRATGGFMGMVAAVGFLGLVFLASQRDLAQKILAFLVKRLPFLGRLKLAEWLDHFLDGLKPLTHPASLANALLWTAISWGLSFTYGYTLMLIFYPQGDAVATLLFIAAASFAVALPAVPGNIGTYELSILLGLSALGYTDTDAGMAVATAFALVVHFLNLAVNALWGVAGFVAEGVSLEQISQGVQRVREAEA
jgi:glycosyltransferase 2 family protein